MVSKVILLPRSKHRKTPCHGIDANRSTVLRSGAPEVSYSSTVTGTSRYTRSRVYVSYIVRFSPCTYIVKPRQYRVHAAKGQPTLTSGQYP